MPVLFECPNIDEKIKQVSGDLKRIDIGEEDLFKQSVLRLQYLYKVKEEYETKFLNSMEDVAIIKAVIDDLNETTVTKGKLYFSDGNVLLSQKVFLDESFPRNNTNLYVFDMPLIVVHIYHNLTDDTFSANCYFSRFGTSFDSEKRLLRDQWKSVQCFNSIESIYSSDFLSIKM